jgi:phosphoribosylaminoimidazolecarboxamide formyltransferase/IMP cyclohydrolase
VRSLRFKPSVKRQDRVNARVAFVEGDMTPVQRRAFDDLFEVVPEDWTREEHAAHLATLDDVALSSDAFFPFRDGIDVAARFGVRYIAQPGGSVGDDAVIHAANQHGIHMAFTGIRTFHH